MDPLCDMLTIIRNGLSVKKEEVVIPHSFFKERIAKLLKREGYLASVKTKVKEKKKSLIIGLKYRRGEPAIKELIPISKAGLRIYQQNRDLRPYKPYAGYGKAMGVVVLSTSQGLMTGREARKKNIGGQVLFKLS